ncbi:MAG: hypothetical protein FWE18_03035 [Alphaproteobacteria bacterium]|nr:hypothetical protein [Alphaproteobacteria bacterium]
MFVFNFFKRKKNIVFIVRDYEVTSGFTNTITTIAEELAKYAKVQIITPAFSYSKDPKGIGSNESIIKNKIILHKVSSEHLSKDFVDNLFSDVNDELKQVLDYNYINMIFPLYKKLLHLNKKQKIDIVCAFAPTSPHFFALRDSKFRVVSILATPFGFKKDGSFDKDSFFSRFDIEAMKHTKYVIADSHSIIEVCDRYYNGNIPQAKTIHLGLKDKNYK